MLDNSIRVAWLDELYRQIRARMDWQHLPENVCATVGFPPTRARGKKGERCGSWMSASYQGAKQGHWEGNDNEKAFITVHPEKMKDGRLAGEAMLEGMYKAIMGARSWRRRARRVIAEASLDDILSTIGPPPPGYAEIPEARAKQRSRLRKYVCDGDGSHIIRAATDSLQATCDTCKAKFTLEQ